jgi:16S rRNA (guanine(527)-N(7))-methyltransferase RsmG
MSTSASTGLRDLLAAQFPLLKPEQWDLLEAHYQLLLRWNRVMNLTRIEDVREAAERHYGEALFVASHIPPAAGARIVDIGSGAGFPGFPIAVARPSCEVTLVESHQRKAVFLREAARGLKNVRVVAKRAEAVTERFELAVSRAVSYDDLLPSLARLAHGIILLTGAEAPPESARIQWEEVEKLPWGKQRFLRFGQCAL